MDELSKALEAAVAESVKKETAPTNVQLGLLVTVVDTLMSFLVYKNIVNREDLQAMIDKALEQKIEETKTVGSEVESVNA